MRIGNNPMRKKGADRVPKIVAAVITHLPNLQGYHKGRLEVVQTCLTTMRDHAGINNVGIYVWDNGSGPELRDWLIDEYQPDFLMLSKNVGKASARAAILRSFPDETAVGISDDDMYFYPGWLPKHIKLLEKFPNVGVVSGWPVRTQFKWGIKSTITWAEQHADELISGRLISAQEDKDFCHSIGRDYDWHKNVYSSKNFDYLIKWNGIEAYATAHHCQFVGYAGRLADLAEYNAEAMSNEKPFDKAIDEAGLLRLTTVERTTRHIGNALDEEFRIQPLNIEIKVNEYA